MGVLTIKKTNTKTGKTETIVKHNVIGGVIQNLPQLAAICANNGLGNADFNNFIPHKAIANIGGTGTQSTTSKLEYDNYNPYNCLILTNSDHSYASEYAGTPTVPNLISGDVIGYATTMSSSATANRGHYVASKTTYSPTKTTITAYFNNDKANSTFNKVYFSNYLPSLVSGTLCSPNAPNVYRLNTPQFTITLDGSPSTFTQNNLLFYPYVNGTTIGGGMTADGLGTAVYYETSSRNLRIMDYEIDRAKLTFTTRYNWPALSTALNWTANSMNFFEDENYIYLIVKTGGNGSGSGNFRTNIVNKSTGAVVLSGNLLVNSDFVFGSYSCGILSDTTGGSRTAVCLRAITGAGNMQVKPITFDTSTATPQGGTVINVTTAPGWDFINTTAAANDIFSEYSVQCILDYFVIAGRKIPIQDFLNNTLQPFWSYPKLYDTNLNSVVTKIQGNVLSGLLQNTAINTNKSLYFENTPLNAALIELDTPVTKTSDDILEIAYTVTVPDENVTWF